MQIGCDSADISNSMKVWIKRLRVSGAIILLASFLVGCAQAPSPPTPTSAPQPKPAAKESAPTPVPTPAAKADAAPAAKGEPKPMAKAEPAPAAKAESKPTPAAKAEPKSPVAPLARVKVGSVGGSATGALFVGMERGYFTEQGIEVELVNFKTSADMVPPLATGELDVGSGALGVGIYNAVLRGVTLKLVASQATYLKNFGSMAITIRKDLIDSGAIKDFKDLKRRKVALAATASAMELLLDTALRKGGLTLNDVDLITLGYDDMNVAFANKAIDAALQNEPSVTIGQDNGFLVRWKRGDEIYEDQEVTGWIYSERFGKNQPEVARRFMVALLRGARGYVDAFQKNKGKDEVISILTKYTSLKDPALYAKIIPSGLPPNGYFNKDLVAADLEWYYQKGYMKEKIDLNAIIDHQYVDYAIGVIGRYE